MCGIAGIVYRQSSLPLNTPHQAVLQLLRHRGPDNQGYITTAQSAFYHSRLSIVDTSPASNQPFCPTAGKELLIFNGEIFNYRQLAANLPQLETSGDVEVLFRLLKNEGVQCLNQLNGFFAFAFYNQSTHSLLLARDRFGVKPLYYFIDGEKFAFASELKPLLKLTGPQELDTEQLYTYFRLNYCAGKHSIFKNIFRLMPGECINLDAHSFDIKTWYRAPVNTKHNSLFDVLNDAVKLRLNADVPVGTFLSGGIDSSIISALAIQHKPQLETFSIGFENEAYFDETAWSEKVARHIGSKHHVVKLKEDDFLQHIEPFLQSIDEPFADSSAFNFYLLSHYTRQHVKVALSGDGADELFKGYNKHRALLLSNNYGNRLFARTADFLLSRAKNSRQGVLQNKLRQLKKFNRLSDLNPVQKQQFLASISSYDECAALLKSGFDEGYFSSLFALNTSYKDFTFEDVFDLQTVLTDDMLVKADRFSMRHGLEIRNPFLDYRVVEYALNLPNTEKISNKGQKLILKKEFSQLLPPEIFTRSKKGFEVPLQKWLSNQLRGKVEHEWLNREKIEADGVLNYAEVLRVQQQAFSDNPGDSAARLWAIVVFTNWWRNIQT